MQFKDYLISQKPLYANNDLSEFKLPANEVVSLVEEYLKLYPQVVTVEMHEPKKCDCGKVLYPSYYCNVCDNDD